MQLPARLGIKYHQQEQVNTTHSVAVRVKKRDVYLNPNLEF